MKIKSQKVKRELIKNYGWYNLDLTPSNTSFSTSLIKDVISVIDNILKEQKGISIK